MTISFIYILGFDDSMHKDVANTAWLISEYDIPRSKSKIKFDINFIHTVEKMGIKFADCFLYHSNGSEREFEIIFDFNNLYTKKKIELIEDFVFWFSSELRLPKTIKISKGRVAPKNIFSLFIVL
jgi:hypothetical protein